MDQGDSLDLIDNPEVWAWVKTHMRPLHAIYILKQLAYSAHRGGKVAEAFKTFQATQPELTQWMLKSIKGDSRESDAYSRERRMLPTYREVREFKDSVKLFNKMWHTELRNDYFENAKDTGMSRSSLLVLLEKLGVKSARHE